jgi:DNA helicase HerA-like ATPase
MDDGGETLGHIVSVRGSRLTSELTQQVRDGGPSGTAGAAFGALVKLPMDEATVYGVVAELWMASGTAGHGPMMSIDLLGEVAAPAHGTPPRFQRGVTRYPRLGQEVRAVSQADLALVFAHPDVSCVRLGTVQQSSGLPAYVVTDGLLGKHFAVLGTTGTGKSCTVALILQAILQRHPNGHVLILDPHNEYAPAFGSRAVLINPASLRLPYWMMNGDELISALVSADGPEREAEVNILKQAVLDARRRFASAEDDPVDVTLDSPVPFRLGDLLAGLQAGMGKLNKTESSLPYLRLQARLDLLTNDNRFNFLFEGLTVKDSMIDVLAQLLRVPVDGQPVTIIDLSGVPGEVTDAVVSMICRMMFDFAVWSAEPQAVPMLLVCEEAHRYIPEDERLGFALSRRALARIAREGRKYGVALCLVSQRPSELSSSILSQCNTMFALRMTNDRDQDFIRRVLPDGASGLLAALPALHNREALVVGEGVTMPMRVVFDDLSAAERPRSCSASFASAWEYDTVDLAFLSETIERWRHQDRASWQA